MKKLFGTDGIRGVANRHPMTPEMAVAIGRAVAAFFKTDSSTRVIIGKDTLKLMVRILVEKFMAFLTVRNYARMQL